jgi:sensor domain CHASE-containing protein
LLVDPTRSSIAKETVRSEEVVVAGPLTLKQCPDCYPTVQRAFIARLPIKMEGFEIVVDGKIYERWGFAVALINWDALIERSDI